MMFKSARKAAGGKWLLLVFLFAAVATIQRGDTRLAGTAPGAAQYVSQLVVGFAVFQLVIGYFSHIFQANYLMILILLAFAYLSDAEEYGVCSWSEKVVAEDAGR